MTTAPTNKSRMRLLFYNHTGQVSGAEHVLLLGLAHLPKERFETALLCPADSPLSVRAAFLGTACFPVAPLQARMTKNPVRLVKYLGSIAHNIFRVRRQILALSPDLIHANTIRAGIVATLATTGHNVPVIWHVHDILQRNPIGAFIRLLAGASRRTSLVACSHAAAASISSRASESRTTVIHNGIECEKFQSDPALAVAAREELGLSPQDFVVGIVGQVAERKGHLGLVRAFAEAKKRIATAKLLVVGAPLFPHDHEYLNLLRQEVERLGLERDVKFLGQRNDVHVVMQSFDLLALNSKGEPFGLVLLEALMMGKAVVATDSGGPAEIIQAGVHGELVPVGDVNALAAAIVKAADERALGQTAAKSGPEHVRTYFSSALYIQRLQMFYATLHASAGVSQVQAERPRLVAVGAETETR